MQPLPAENVEMTEAQRERAQKSRALALQKRAEAEERRRIQMGNRQAQTIIGFSNFVELATKSSLLRLLGFINMKHYQNIFCFRELSLNFGKYATVAPIPDRHRQ